METIVILLFAAGFSLGFGFYILFFSARRFEFFNLGVLCLILGAWEILFSIPFFPNADSETLFWTRTLTIPMAFGPLFLIRFIHFFVLNERLSSTKNLFVIFGYVVPILSLVYSDFYISSAMIQNGKLHFTAGIAYDYFVIGGVCSLFYSIWIITKGFQHRRGLERVKFVYIAVGIFVWFTFIGTFTFLLRHLGLPEYNFVAPIGCALAIAIWSIGVFKIDLFELPDYEIISDKNSLIAQANIMILKNVDMQTYEAARFHYRKKVIMNIVGRFTYLQVNSDLSVDEIFDRLSI
ncbi:histidine kinase N-terminal 7TM domain-containing protein [Leptospira ellisii]|uniref:Histidine kinase N-terminal 7TM domain-containing protein n=1 Tax=Leptospira ellisii TaxID=2023197 RepID=A0AAE4TXK8_9LEPT|nr:histidine kinase N-terminal 7TM domain-containing protein [Leptospira ellisii]MDV6237143.1 histidine kinase N-terminal 7TM domain-containing protein [Leptospira ellisii]